MTLSRPGSLTRRSFSTLFLGAGGGLLATAFGFDQAMSEELKQSGTLQVKQTQVAWIGSANLGGGQLFYKGKTYNFTIGGLGIGGIGISTITAVGTVYNMTDVSQFPGAYGQARQGFAAGTTGGGELWLQNPADVVLKLKCEREGLALSLGADAIYIEFD